MAAGAQALPGAVGKVESVIIGIIYQESYFKLTKMSLKQMCGANKVEDNCI